jgi:uncharacterized protein
MRKEWIMMSAKDNSEVLLGIFNAIEQRDPQRVLELCCPDVEFHWPPSLPYGGVSRGLASGRPTWSETWIPLQPTDAERRMDARIVATSEDEVVVLWQQRGVSPTGDRFDGPVLGLYRIRDNKLARAQMFYFDAAEVARFLAKVKDPAIGIGLPPK